MIANLQGWLQHQHAAAQISRNRIPTAIVYADGIHNAGISSLLQRLTSKGGKDSVPVARLQVLPQIC